MNREEILAKSRQENKNKDLFDKEVEGKSIAFSGIAMVIMCLVYYVAEILLQSRKNYGFFSIAAIYMAILFMMKGSKLKDKKKFYLGIVWLALAILFTVEHFYFLVTNATIF